jgi:predicted dehydrogenase
MNRRKIVFAGCGGITGAWMNAVSRFDDVEVVGLCDLDPERIAAFEEKWKMTAAAKGADLDRVISESGADTVFDCTIPAAHPLITTTALEAGCDVLGEKPMAPSLDEARSMVAAARKTGRTYAVIQNRRYQPEIRRFRDALANADLGPLTTLDVDFYIGAHFGGFRAEMDHVLLLDMAIHTFDQARYISGADPLNVFAADWNPGGSWYRDGANAVAFFEMSNGLRFTYRGSWCSEGLNTSWEGSWRAVCEQGTITWDGAQEVRGEREAGGENLIHNFEPLEIGPSAPITWTGHGGVIRDFLDALQNRTKPMTDCTDNINSIAMVLAAVESAESGRPVQIWKEM